METGVGGGQETQEEEVEALFNDAQSKEFCRGNLKTANFCSVLLVFFAAGPSMKPSGVAVTQFGRWFCNAPKLIG